MLNLHLSYKYGKCLLASAILTHLPSHHPWPTTLTHHIEDLVVIMAQHAMMSMTHHSGDDSNEIYGEHIFICLVCWSHLYRCTSQPHARMMSQFHCDNAAMEGCGEDTGEYAFAFHQFILIMTIHPHVNTIPMLDPCPHHAWQPWHHDNGVVRHPQPPPLQTMRPSQSAASQMTARCPRH